MPPDKPRPAGAPRANGMRSESGEHSHRAVRLVDEGEVGLYLAETCHELRTPVAVLTLITGILDKGDGLAPDRLSVLVEAVERQCVELRVTIDRYLEHGELIFGGGQSQELRFDVDLVVQEAVESLVPLIPKDRLEVSLESAQIRGDPRRLSSIVTNLLVNAARYSDQTSVIEVGVSSGHRCVTLEVADRGNGIPEESRRVLLEPFHRGSGAAVQLHDGAGLGLAIVAGHVQALRGALRIHDRREGGSVVAVTLPRY